MSRLTRTVLLCFVAIVGTVTAKHDYQKALHKTTRYYGAQRCGDTKSWIHGACHTRDGERDGLDLSGGWHDCGDNIKFAQTNAFTAAVLLQMYNRFPEAYADDYTQDYSLPPSNGIPDILDEVKIFTDYLLKAIVDGKVYYQTGDYRDHRSLSDPVWQSENAVVDTGGEPRYSYSITEGGSNYCGAAAAALSLMALNYKPFDAAYSQRCIETAEAYFAVGRKNPGAVVDADTKFYGGATKWEDDMILGGTQLFRVTGKQEYLTYAENLFMETWHVPTGVSMDYNNCGPLMAYEIYKVSKRDSVIDKSFNSMVGWNYKTTGEIGGELEGLLAGMQECGYGHYLGWGSLKYATAAAQTALLIHDMTGLQEAYDFAKKNIDFCLGSHDGVGGDGGANFSFVVGYDELGGGAAQYPHHVAAFGKQENAGLLWKEENANPGTHPFEHELTGALVGGPVEPCSGYEDRIDNYYSNEVCIYYNCHIVGSLAYIIRHEQEMPVLQSQLASIADSRQQYRINSRNAFSLPAKQGNGETMAFYTLAGKEIGRINLHATAEIIDLKQAFGIGQQLLVAKVLRK